MIKRKGFIDTFADAAHYGNYDELPILPPDTDPQIHASRNDRAQPFYLICEKDSMLVQLSGTASIVLQHPQARMFMTQPGDYVYVPAGTPHRIVPAEVGIMHRYKARDAGLEGAAWYCEGCGAEVSRAVWDTALEIPQRAYARVAAAFNADPAARACAACGAVHPPLALDGLRWDEIAGGLAAEVAA